MKLSEELQWRNQIKDMTFDSVEQLDQPGKFYLGSDCSSDSLTIGNLAVYMLARRLRKHGWKAVLLVGGATSLIGDPGGKDSERELKSKEEIAKNVAGIQAQVQKLFGDMDFELVNNYDWFKDIGYLEFLRDVGKHFSMTELLQRDFIASRLGEGAAGISYAEFSYSLVQGYDFWHLYRNNQVTMQIGGSDQWGNMLSGVPLIRKKEDAEAHALSMPLVIDKTTGKKFGKSEGGAVWLDEKKTSVYKFYQFWINVDDVGVEDYLKIYTELDKDQIDQLMVQHRSDESQRIAQKKLAYEVTKLIHGEDRADSVVRITDVLFGTESYNSLNADDFEQLSKELPSIEVEISTDFVQMIVDLGLASSKGDARRFIESRAFAINGVKMDVQKNSLDSEDFISGFLIIRRGKNQNAVVKLI